MGGGEDETRGEREKRGLRRRESRGQELVKVDVGDGRAEESLPR